MSANEKRAFLQQVLKELQAEEFAIHLAWMLVVRQVEHVTKHLEALEGS